MLKRRITFVILILLIMLLPAGFLGRLPYSVLYAVLLMPFLSLAHLVLEAFTIHSSAALSENEVPKGTDVDLRVTVSNESFLPAPYLTVCYSLPDRPYGLGTKKIVSATLKARSALHFSQTLSCARRGEYIGSIVYIDIYDMLGIFRWRLHPRAEVKLNIVPRRLAAFFPDEEIAAEDPRSAVSRSVEDDFTNMNGIREYQPGDPLKTIHWKLSSKSEELIVKLFQQQIGIYTLIVADMVAYGDLDTSENVGDGVVESALAAAYGAVLRGRSCRILWNDEDGRRIQNVTAFDEMEKFFSSFSVAPVLETGISAEDLLMTGITYDMPPSTVLTISANLTAKLVSCLSALAPGGQYDLHLVYIETVYNARHERALTQLAADGISIWRVQNNDITTAVDTDIVA